MIFTYNTTKRIFDLFFAIILSPILLIPLVPCLLLVYLFDFNNPIYTSKRGGLRNTPFRMFKVRSMSCGISAFSSTSSSDPRITPIGKFIRKYKLDEIPQIFNIILGQMSFVGPRPNVYPNGIELYTQKQLSILNRRPGIVDLSSIVFADEGDILNNSTDPDLDYNKKIWPLKSSLSLLYVKEQSFLLDFAILFLLILSFWDRKLTLRLLSSLVFFLTGDSNLAHLSSRNSYK